MNITIRENLKTLRAAKDCKQEELARHLGISTQAVSKWERGEGYPDIELLPAISAFYNVSVDDLLGVGEVRRRERLDEIFARERDLAFTGDTKTRLRLMRDAYAEFPNDFRVMAMLMNALYSDNQFDAATMDEIIALGERILAECTDGVHRATAIELTCYAYIGKGDRVSARRYADMSPNDSYLMLSVLQGEELLRHTQAIFERALDEFYLGIMRMFEAREFTDAEKIHIWKQELKLHECVYEDGDFGFKNTRMAWLHIDIARLYAQSQDRENTLYHLGEATRHARIYDKMERRVLHSPLMEGFVYEPTELRRNYEGTELDMVLRSTDAPRFDFLRDEPEFNALLRRE
ncbi:MAG: helix-turn-helix domain-containing protein [Oscillospiraceae bacterium]|jgi:transcriptional regulator with XRE-family HTH domain|nr:helix-turn-helix domain-containing protein [Oscillospiraceae bacterium]